MVLQKLGRKPQQNCWCRPRVPKTCPRGLPGHLLPGGAGGEGGHRPKAGAQGATRVGPNFSVALGSSAAVRVSQATACSSHSGVMWFRGQGWLGIGEWGTAGGEAPAPSSGPKRPDSTHQHPGAHWGTAHCACGHVQTLPPPSRLPPAGRGRLLLF